jgi:hypothetical protein
VYCSALQLLNSWLLWLQEVGVCTACVVTALHALLQTPHIERTESALLLLLLLLLLTEHVLAVFKICN